MSNDTPTLKSWRSVQVYTLSAICLLIGVTMGYLVRGSTAGKTPSTPPAATGGGNPAAGIPLGSSAPNENDMKRMAEKQVAPLLAQLQNNPNDPELTAKIAHYYMVANQYNDAVVYYEKTVAVKPTPEYLTALANAYYFAGKPDKAMENLNRALKEDPNFADALFNVGVIKWQVQGDTQGAIASWEKLIKTNPKHPQLDEVRKMIAKAKQHEKVAPGTKTDKPAM
jgi:cytochrome c-type biogenesis protein CcmH/NrfG